MLSKSVIRPARILLPNKKVNLNHFAVIACDQFTSEIEYWDSLKKEIGDDPSTFNMMFPEAYLGKVDEKLYIDTINQTIQEYLDKKIITDVGECFILVDRETKYTKRRLGLMISIDLEDYTYQKGVKSLIRASEATIVERIPPRLKIRENAPVELPHILFLYDDKDKCINEELYANRNKYECVYDFELNKDGGHIKGYLIKNTESIIKKFYDLFKKNNNGLMFIVGDGNHSLATAKAHWDKIKVNLSEEERKNHPARYALVEAMNIYDEGLNFEPIHRLIITSDDFVSELQKIFKDEYKVSVECDQGLISFKGFKNPPMVYKLVQSYIDRYLASHKDAKVDYIHDIDHLLDVMHKTPNSIAIEMPALTKGDVFDYIAKDEVLPRKSFSMGNATEKRYYLESKRIK